MMMVLYECQIIKKNTHMNYYCHTPTSMLLTVISNWFFTIMMISYIALTYIYILYIIGIWRNDKLLSTNLVVRLYDNVTFLLCNKVQKEICWNNKRHLQWKFMHTWNHKYLLVIIFLSVLDRKFQTFAEFVEFFLRLSFFLFVVFLFFTPVSIYNFLYLLFYK